MALSQVSCLLFFEVGAEIQETKSNQHQNDDEDEEEERECARCSVLVLARIAREVYTALAVTILADAAVCAMWIALLIREASYFLDDHITTLSDDTHLSVHFELHDYEPVPFRNKILRQLDDYRLVADLPTAREEAALIAMGCDRMECLAVAAQLDRAVACFCDALCPPLDVVP